MTPVSSPFPKTLAALHKLSAKQQAFCSLIQDGHYSSTAYRRVYNNSRSVEKMAYKVKSSRFVRAYLAAEREESLARARAQREAENAAKHRWLAGAERTAFITSFVAALLEEIRSAQRLELQQQAVNPGNVAAFPAAGPPHHVA